MHIFEQEPRFSQSPRRLVVITAIAIMTTGCSTIVTYKPQTTGESQTLQFNQGVGVLSVKDTDQEVFMYPTYRTQKTDSPTFTIGYANNGTENVNFSPDNVKAYFRSEQMPLYSYDERIAEIQSEKEAKQALLAVLGGLAAVGAAHASSRQTYNTKYSGFVSSPRNFVGFAGSTKTTVYDPAAGILAGAMVGGATVLGVRQLEYSAQAQEQAAASMLQATTVEPLKMVSGDLIVKNCCDQFVKPNDMLRFEVTAKGKVYEFNFVRQKSN
ncbi:MAG: hypothetical protein LBI87_10820 [Candidatus Accumulibacter sp.]|jgi:hypothetical protein|nr:hypothetical protein [Accumulibacter sp.]